MLIKNQLANDFNEQYERILKATGAETDTELARKLGITPPSITGVKKRGVIPLHWFEKVSKQYAVSMDYLMGGTLENHILKHLPHAPHHENEQLTPSVIQPFIDPKTGQPMPKDVKWRYRFNKEHLKTSMDAKPNACVILKATSMDMYPEIKPDDAVLIDTSKTQLLPGKIFAIAIHGLIQLCYVDINLTGYEFKFCGDRENITVTPDAFDQLVKVVGQVKWVCREHC